MTNNNIYNASLWIFPPTSQKSSKMDYTEHQMKNKNSKFKLLVENNLSTANIVDKGLVHLPLTQLLDQNMRVVEEHRHYPHSLPTTAF